MTSDRNIAAARYDAAALVQFASQLFQRTGWAEARAATVAEILVEGDLLGHTTHGMQRLARYLV